MNAPSMPWGQAIAENLAASNKFVLPDTLPTLQEMSSYRIALSIWYSYLSSHSNLNEVEKKNSNDLLISIRGLDEHYVRGCDKMVESLKTPTSIEQTLKSTVESIYQETNSWIKHFQYYTFSYNLARHQIQHFDANWWVWSANGKLHIDYAKTASKMLSVPGLSLEQRFAIMSQYCMEEEIKKIPSSSLSASFIDAVNFNRDFLIYYWIRYLKNELGTIPLRNFTSLDVQMAVKCDESYWPAFEYFWHRLGVDDQVFVAEFRFNDYKSQIHQDRVFSKMSWPQQHRLLSKIPDQILLTFYNRLNSIEFATWTWNTCRDLMTPQQFVRVIKEVLDHQKKINRYLFNKPVFSADQLHFMLQLWNSASDEQRNELVQSHTVEDEVIKQFILMCNFYNVAFDFLYEFFSVKTPESRKQAMIRNGGEFAYHIDDYDSMNKIMGLCFPNLIDQVSYKKLVMKSPLMQKRAEILFNTVNFDCLVSKVKFYWTDTKTYLKFMNRLLASPRIIKVHYFVKVDKWNKFSQFVDESLSDLHPEDVTSALDIKKNFITSYAQVCRNHWNHDSFDETIEILEMALTSDEELQLVKNHLLESFKPVLSEFNYWKLFEEKYFNKFVSWCLNGDENAIVEFVKNVPIGAIFDKHFECLLDLYRDSYRIEVDVLEDLDRCLRWYFEGVEGARQYKVDKINAFEVELFRVILHREDESNLDIILKWVFDSDEEAVQKFKIEELKNFESSAGELI